MSDPGFDIDIDPTRNRVHIVYRGGWNRAKVERFSAELEIAMLRMQAGGARRGDYLVLIDQREQGIIPQDVMPYFDALIAGTAPLARRIAVLTNSALARMQVKRVTGPASQFRLFVSAAEAWAWIDEPAGSGATR